MNFIGLGTDIVNIDRVKKIIIKNKYFIKKILHEKEVKILKQQRKKIDSTLLAKRFAAKEAVSKAIGYGFSNKIYLKNILVLHDKYGKPSIRLIGTTDVALKKKFKSYKILISISDDKPWAIATALLLA